MICAACSSLCQNCDYAATNCTSCNSSAYLYGNICVGSCSLQLNYSYGNNTDRKCYPCGTNCQQCTNSTYCTTCVNNATVTTYNYNGKCMTTCPDNTLTSTSPNICLPCASNCAHCVTTVSNCDVCNSAFYLNMNSCIAKCPDGKYPDTSFAC